MRPIIACIASIALLVTVIVSVTLTAPATAQPGAAARAAAYKPTLKGSTHDVVAGKKVVLSGKVRPATAGGTVIIQKRIAGRKWAGAARTTMNRAGRFSVTDKPSTPGLRKYRAVVPRSGKHKTGVSEPVPVAVRRWLYLDNDHVLPMRAHPYTYTTKPDPAVIDGVEYWHGFQGNQYSDNGFVDWNLNRACTTLKARFGESDLSDLTATSHIDVRGDGVSRYSKDFGLGQSEPKTLDITGVFRLGFTWTSSNPAADPDDPSRRIGAVPAFVEAQVLCAF